jgi:pimeloyl-ACP methyl ester carboxylesterase
VSAVSHRLLDVPAGRIHVAEQGSGPLVLLVHGFPECWYSWRHQLPAIAEAGYHAVAMDVRGYGRSSKPPALDAYRMLDLVADTAGVVTALGEDAAIVIGHDWGSPIATSSALVRPDLVRAVGMLSVPYAPRGGPRPTDILARIGRPEEFYVSYFQEPGRAEAEIEPDVRTWLGGFYGALSGEAEPPPDGGSVSFVAQGGRLRDRFPEPGPLPAWLSEDDLGVYAGEFERTGFTGALNRYRNMDRDWEDLAAWDGAPVVQPSLFVAGENDATLRWMGGAIEAFGTTLPGLGGSHILPGAGHWIQQERPGEVNRLLVEWLEVVAV